MKNIGAVGDGSRGSRAKLMLFEDWSQNAIRSDSMDFTVETENCLEYLEWLSRNPDEFFKDFGIEEVEEDGI